MRVKKLSGVVFIFLFIFLFAAPGICADRVKDIGEEVLTGPNDMNPEKILGPGSIGIETSKDILMSFGATVRFIPTSENNYDFGISEKIQGFFDTQPIKDFTRSAANTAQAAQDVYTTSHAVTSAVSTSQGVMSALDDFQRALTTAQATIGSAVNPLTQGVASLRPAANSAYNTTYDSYVAAVKAGDTSVAGAALQAIATNPNYQAAVAAGNVAGAQQVANAIAGSYASQAANAAAASVLTGNNSWTQLSAGADSVAQNVAAQITGNPSASASNITDAVAYTSVLKATADSFSPFYLANSFLKTHSNESGSVNDGYIRNETKLFFNAMPKDKKWSFYAALEFDRPLDTQTIDNRGGKSDASSNFGLERLNASIELVEGLRLHAGWDVWGLDVIESASMVYGDDNAGFWLNGRYNPIHFSVAWLKLEENDFQISPTDHTGASDADRDLIAGYFDYLMGEGSKIRLFYAYDRIRNVKAGDLLGAMARDANLGKYAGISGGTPETDAHNIGAYYLGKLGWVELMAEGVYKFGKANETGLKGVYNGVSTIQYDDFDIESYAFSADIGVELGEAAGWMSLKPHIGMMWTSGDDDPNDDTLSGYSGVTNAQRFSRMWGGENTIIGDTNFVLGTALYGYLPELYGNGTPVFVGGLQNMAGSGNGRGDNPGLTMYSFGLTLRPKIYLIFRTNWNMFNWNEDFYVTNMVQPVTVASMAGGTKVAATRVEAGYVGSEWDNELTLALSKNMFIRGQVSFFFPGEATKEVTKALTGGMEGDDTASRFAAELIWNF